MKNGTTVEYKGYTLTKEGKTYWTIRKPNHFGYAASLKIAKQCVDQLVLKNS